MKRKFLSVLLCFCMVLAMIPTAFAEGMTVEEPPVVPQAAAELGAVVQLTPTAKIDPKTFEVNSQSVPGYAVSINPNAEVPYAAARPGYHEAGWWVGVKIQAPSTVTNSSSNSVKFRSANNGADRAWVTPTIDGGTGTTEDPLYMEAWVGYAESWLKLDKLPGGSSVRWYFNWDGSDSTGSTIPASEFTNPADGKPLSGATDMAGVDQIIEVTFMAADAGELKDASGKVVYPVKSTVGAVRGEDGTVTVDKTEMNHVIDAASKDTSTDKTATVEVTGAASGATTVALDKDVFSTAQTAGVNLAVKAGNVATVTLGSAALEKIKSASGTDKVSISVQNVTSDSSVTKPTVANATVAASYKVEVAVGSSKIEGTTGWGTENANIKLTVPKGSVTDTNKVKVYLDTEEATGASVVANGDDKLDITVPHLSVVSLVETQSVGGDDPETPESGTVTTADELNVAVTAATGATTIKLGANISATATITIPADKTITLDLNGKELTGNNSYTIKVLGKLTVIDTSAGEPGQINNTHATASTIDVDNGGTLTLGGEKGANSNFIIENAQNKATTDNSALKVEEQGTMVINGGTVKGPKAKTSDTPETANRRSIQSFGTTTINGGTFEGEVQVWTWQSAETNPSTLTITGGLFKDTVAVCNTSTASADTPFTGTLDIQGGTFTNDNADTDGYNIGIQIPTAREEDESITAEIKVTSDVTFPAPINTKYLDGDMSFEAATSAGAYSYHKTQAEATAAAGAGGNVKVITSNGTVELPKNIECTYTEVTGTQIPGDSNPNHVYYAGSMFGGQLKLTGLNKSTKYVVQLAKAGSYNAENCTIVVFTTGADSTEQTVEVLKSAQGYTVSLYMFTDNNGTDIRDVVTTNLNKTTITKS